MGGRGRETLWVSEVRKAGICQRNWLAASGAVREEWRGAAGQENLRRGDSPPGHPDKGMQGRRGGDGGNLSWALLTQPGLRNLAGHRLLPRSPPVPSSGPRTGQEKRPPPPSQPAPGSHGIFTKARQQERRSQTLIPHYKWGD